jgi:hypothetical protein
MVGMQIKCMHRCIEVECSKECPVAAVGQGRDDEARAAPEVLVAIHNTLIRLHTQLQRESLPPWN